MEYTGALKDLVIIGSIPAVLTTLGGIPILFISRVEHEDKLRALGLGFSSGIMLVASFTSLLIPSIELSNVFTAIAGFILGILLIRVLDISIPHMHIVRGYEGPLYSKKIHRIWLIALAMIIHNIPEGMAVGAAILYNVDTGLTLAIAIGIQDIPEGLAVSLPMALIDIRKRYRAFIVAALSGLSEFLAAFIPFILVAVSFSILPIFLALAAGAMIYVVVHEIIPETMTGKGNELATLSFIVGFITMLLLDSLL